MGEDEEQAKRASLASSGAGRLAGVIQRQHRLGFHWLWPVHRWGTLELGDLKSWVRCLTGGRRRELCLALYKDPFIPRHSRPQH